MSTALRDIPSQIQSGEKKKKKKDVNYLQPFNDTYMTQHCGTI